MEKACGDGHHSGTGGGTIDSPADFQTTYFILEKAFEFLCHRPLESLLGVSKSTDRFQALLDRARARQGELADRLLPVFEETWRQNDIVRRRDQIQDANHRFFLALLLNVPDRSNVLRLVKERFPEKDPVELIVGWLKELCATKTFGSREPNVLGIGNFEESHFFVFKELLLGRRAENIGADLATADFTAPFQDVANQIKSLPLFKSIFAF